MGRWEAYWLLIQWQRNVTANMFRFSAGVMEIPKLTMGRVYACQHIKIHQMYFKWLTYMACQLFLSR